MRARRHGAVELGPVVAAVGEERPPSLGHGDHAVRAWCVDGDVRAHAVRKGGRVAVGAVHVARVVPHDAAGVAPGRVVVEQRHVAQRRDRRAAGVAQAVEAGAQVVARSGQRGGARGGVAEERLVGDVRREPGEGGAVGPGAAGRPRRVVVRAAESACGAGGEAADVAAAGERLAVVVAPPPAREGGHGLHAAARGSRGGVHVAHDGAVGAHGLHGRRARAVVGARPQRLPRVPASDGVAPAGGHEARAAVGVGQQHHAVADAVETLDAEEGGRRAGGRRRAELAERKRPGGARRRGGGHSRPERAVEGSPEAGEAAPHLPRREDCACRVGGAEPRAEDVRGHRELRRRELSLAASAA